MLLSCTNKGCLKSNEAKLDIKNNDVICGECGKTISNISSSMKITLKSFGQVIKENTKKAFMVACKNCKADREVVFDENENTSCKVCHSIVQVNAAMKLAMQQFSDKSSDISETDEAILKKVRPKIKTTKNEKK